MMNSSPANTQDDMFDDLLGDFLDESDQLLTQLNENLLQLDEWVQQLTEDNQEQYDDEVLNEMFRAAHSLKGLSAMLGLTDINQLTHKIENVFDAARHGELRVTPNVTELMFMGLDQLVAMVELLKDSGREPVDCSEVLEGIRSLLQTTGTEQKQGSQADAERIFQAGMAEAPRSAPVPIVNPLEGLKNEKEIPDNYLSLFIDESEASLDEFTGGLLTMEGGKNSENLRDLLRVMHKIKGSAASIGLNRAAKLAHMMEDLFENLVARGKTLSPEWTDVLLQCADALHQYLKKLKSGEIDSDDFDRLACKLLEIQNESDAADAAGQAVFARSATLAEQLAHVVSEIGRRLSLLPGEDVAAATGIDFDEIVKVLLGEHAGLFILKKLAAYCDASPPAADEEAAPSTAGPEADCPVDAGTTAYTGEVRFQPDLPGVGLKAQLIYEKLARHGKISHCDPSLDQLAEAAFLEAFRFQIVSDQSLEILLQQTRAGGVLQADIRPLEATGLPSSDTPTSSPEVDSARTDTTPSSPAATKTPKDPSGKEKTSAAAAAKASPSAPAASSPSASSKESASPAKSRKAESGQQPVETVRVDIDRLDQLMDLTGRLVINKVQISQISEKLKTMADCRQSMYTLNRIIGELDKLGEPNFLRLDEMHTGTVEIVRNQVRRIHHAMEPLRRDIQTIQQSHEYIPELFEAVHQLDRISNGIRQGVMDTRMVPIGPLFARFKRVIRDITRANGKDIRLEINGEKTELDKRMIDELGDPLVHMVRNSADHGIELPENREAIGKPRQGTVTLDAFHRGNNIIIEVRDDGKGLDTDRILRKCLEKGIVTETDAEKMTPHQIHQMIWEPGLSTAEKVTDISGRGMGMDIVKSKIEELNGTVDIYSELGKGTTITVKLPLTLAILPSLMVDISGNVFAIPMEAVSEIVKVGREQINTVHGQPMATVRDRVFSLLSLGGLLSFHDGGVGSEPPRETILVIVGETGRQIGLTVDRVIGEEDMVIKSIAENYRNINGIAGATILGDGRVSLILDIPALIEMVSKNVTSTAC